MLDKTDDLDPTLDVPAISVQLSSTIGGTRSLTLTTGLPMDCKKSQLDELLDKITAASDRQKKLFDLEQTRALLKNEEQNLHQHRTQIGMQELKFEQDYNISGRKGEFRPTASQRSVLDGLQKNVVNSSERIQQLRELIVKMEQECR
jgi:O-methyltransferase involved in polyketide biosynthesis